MADELEIMKARRDNPELSKEFVKEALLGKAEMGSGDVQPYVRRVKLKVISNDHTIP